jgi:hypothetical protein
MTTASRYHASTEPPSGTFPHIELCWSVPEHAGHNGVTHIGNIVEAVAPIITQVVDGRVKTARLALRWTFKPSEKVLAKRPASVLGRKMEWIRAFRRKELDPEGGE